MQNQWNDELEKLYAARLREADVHLIDYNEAVEAGDTVKAKKAIDAYFAKRTQLEAEVAKKREHDARWDEMMHMVKDGVTLTCDVCKFSFLRYKYWLCPRCSFPHKDTKPTAVLDAMNDFSKQCQSGSVTVTVKGYESTK